MSLLPAVLLAMGALALWVPDYLSAPERWHELLLTQLLLVANAIMLSALLYQGKATRSFTALPVPLMIITVAVLPDWRCGWLLQVWIAVMLLFLFMMQQMADNQSPNGYVFFFTLVLSVLSLWLPDALWCIVYLWAVVVMMGAFSLRTLLASAIGLVVFIFYYQIAHYFGWSVEWGWSSLLPRSWMAKVMSLHDIITVAVVLVATFAITFVTFRRSSYGFVSTRMLLYHCVMLYLMVIPLVLFFRPDGGGIHALLAVATPAVTGIYLLQTESESRGITFILYFLVALALYAPLNLFG